MALVLSAQNRSTRTNFGENKMEPSPKVKIRLLRGRAGGGSPGRLSASFSIPRAAAVISSGKNPRNSPKRMALRGGGAG